MIAKVKHPKGIDLDILIYGNILKPVYTEYSDDLACSQFNIENCESFEIVIHNSNSSFKTYLFRKNWIRGLKWSFLSVDWNLKEQCWRVHFNSLGNNAKAKLDFLIETDYLENYYNGYIKARKLTILNQKNIQVKIENKTNINIVNKLVLYLYILLNQLPLIVFIAFSTYIDITHPDWFKSGTFSIFLYDIPLTILLFINTIVGIIKTHKSIVKANSI